MSKIFNFFLYVSQKIDPQNLMALSAIACFIVVIIAFQLLFAVDGICNLIRRK